MRAAKVTEKGKVQLVDIPEPEPGPGQVRVRMLQCGICGSDLHVYRAEWSIESKIGHEICGVVDKLGEDVSGPAEGMRVCAECFSHCGQCRFCRQGDYNLCESISFLGKLEQSGLAEKAILPAHTLYEAPESLSDDEVMMVEPLAVACHDVRLGEVKAGEFVVVLGGGPIGALVGLVAQNEGANVVVSEINPDRIRIGRELRLEVVDPNEVDLVVLVNERTGGAGADVVFEVTGSAAGAATMTQLPRTRGRIVVVAIFGHVPPVDLKAILWREMKLCGTRVYERQDFEKAIELASGDALPLDLLITGTYPLERLKDALTELEQGGNAMKILIDVAA